MFKKTIKEVERQTKNGRSYTREEKWCFDFENDKDTAKKGADKKQSWIGKEKVEVRNAVIEACFNNIWHTALCSAITGASSGYVAAFLPYVLVIFPGVSPVVAGVAVGFMTYIVAAVMLSYLRRLVVWGGGKLKNWLFGNENQ